MVFLIVGVLLGLHVVGVDFDRNALLVATVLVLYGELLNWRFVRAERAKAS